MKCFSHVKGFTGRYPAGNVGGKARVRDPVTRRRYQALLKSCAVFTLFWQSSMTQTVPPSFFEDLYSRNADPWDFQTSPYEAAKYEDTVATLPRPKYERALEIGCSIGVLTSRLAAKCQSLLGLDVSAHALSLARTRCATLPGVSFAQMMVPGEFPSGEFDLIVVSEVAYYWSLTDFAQAMNLIADHHRPGGHLILVHYLPFVKEHVQTGDAVHDAWLHDQRWKPLYGAKRGKYRIDLFERQP
jgi:SAM-dependent methyltransferase